MSRVQPEVLPGSGNTDLARLAAALQSAPTVLGISDTAEIRTVRIVSPERQNNWGTILTAGSEVGDDVPERISLANGSLLLLRRVVRLSLINSSDDLTRLFAEWPELPPDEDGEWQQSLHVSRFPGDPEFNQLPYWTIDLPRVKTPSQNPLGTPQEPYCCPETNFFADRLGVAAGKWLKDPNGGRIWEARGTNRVNLFDPRAYFTKVEAEPHQLRISAACREHESLVCWAQVDDFSGTRTDHRVDVLGGEATLAIPEAIQGFELFLFGLNGIHYDRYSSRRMYLVPTDRPRRVRRFTASQESLLQDAASGETLTVELKEWLPPTAEEQKYDDFLKSVCAFANAGGGRIYVGVRDGGEIPGVDKPLKKTYAKDARGDLGRAREMYARKLRQNVREGIEPAFEADFVWIDLAGKSVLCVHVPEGGEKPYQVIAGRQYFIRKNGRSVLALPHEVKAMYLGRRRT
jgi:hypothetical protein